MALLDPYNIKTERECGCVLFVPHRQHSSLLWLDRIEYVALINPFKVHFSFSFYQKGKAEIAALGTWLALRSWLETMCLTSGSMDGRGCEQNKDLGLPLVSTLWPMVPGKHLEDVCNQMCEIRSRRTPQYRHQYNASLISESICNVNYFFISSSFLIFACDFFLMKMGLFFFQIVYLNQEPNKFYSSDWFIWILSPFVFCLVSY